MSINDSKSPEELEHEIKQLKNRIRYMENSYTEYRNSLDNELIQLQQLNQSTRKFLLDLLADLSYDIRISMNGIIGMIDLIRQSNLNHEQKDQLNIVVSSADHMLLLINDIFDYSRIMAGEINLVQKSFSLQRLVESVVETLQVKSFGKNVSVKIAISEQANIELKGDEVRLHQILINLLNNALSNTREGEIVLSVHTIRSDEQSVELCFEMSDTSQGASLVELEKINAYLVSSDDSLVRHALYPGISLALCKKLLQMMGSKLSFNKHDAGGTVAVFNVWLDKSSTIHLREKPIQTKQPYELIKPLKVLLVEDNLLNQKFAYATLKRKGHKVDVAENGKIALEKFFSNSYDLILMDIQLPIMDGIEATIKIRDFEKANTERVPVKILAVTAFALDRDRENCIAAGMDGFLSKPFKPDQLINIIEGLFRP